jgi:hypothetical protein
MAGPTRVGRLPILACGVAVLTCGLWAFWPLDRTLVEAPAITVAAAGGGPSGPVPLDLAAFRAPLWVAPPAPPAPVAAAPPPPPLKLQLIAILSENGQYKAALYDPDSDRLTVVGAGNTIGGRRIERVGKSDVVVMDGALARTLALRTEEGRP